jgi:hypothetical protein
VDVVDCNSVLGRRGFAARTIRQPGCCADVRKSSRVQKLRTWYVLSPWSWFSVEHQVERVKIVATLPYERAARPGPTTLVGEDIKRSVRPEPIRRGPWQRFSSRGVYHAGSKIARTHAGLPDGAESRST